MKDAIVSGITAFASSVGLTGLVIRMQNQRIDSKIDREVYDTMHQNLKEDLSELKGTVKEMAKAQSDLTQNVAILANTIDNWMKKNGNGAK
jgi:hypothetical protein